MHAWTKALATAVVAAAVVLLAGDWVLAQPRFMSACKSDVEKFCKDVKPGAGRIVACLEKHESELGGECKKSLETAKTRVHQSQSRRARQRGGFFGECQEDLDKLCKGVNSGGGRLIKCLEEHTSELSPNCKAYLDKTRKSVRAAMATPAPTPKK